jgi:hypothetical protein
VQQGSVTLRAAATATAASAALPPACRIRRPAWVASGCEQATMPLVEYTGERLQHAAAASIQASTLQQLELLGSSCRACR